MTRKVSEARTLVNGAKKIRVVTRFGGGPNGATGFFQTTKKAALQQLAMYQADEQVWCDRCGDTVYLGVV